MAEAVKTQTKATLPKEVFAVEVNNHELLKLAYDAYLSNSRLASATTKTRGEVRGGGKKPWKQKGTGRARHGSVRSPIWRKGGVTFGPTKERNFVREVSRKMRQKAVLIALSEKIRLGKLVVVDTVALPEKKTKVFAAALKSLAIAPRRVAVSLLGDEGREAIAMRNIPKLSVVHHPDLNVKDLLDHEFVLMTKAGLLDLDRRFQAWKK